MEQNNSTVNDNTNKAKILIVEDDMIIGELYTNSLSDLGYRVTWARDGRNGLTAALQQQPDVILLDIMMPEMSGDTVLKKLRGNGENKVPNSKIIVFTNSVRNKDANGLGKYADDYLIKADITPRQLIAKIDQLLSKNA